MLPRIDYEKALDIQKRIQRKRIEESIPDTLLLLEHYPVITVGRNGHDEFILRDRSFLSSEGIPVIHTDRGGDVTYHGPGQIIGYAVIHLYREERSLRKYVERVEQVIIDMLAEEWDIRSARNERQRGVWIGDRKIAALGISISRGVTMHGFAFNVETDLHPYSYIIPCGIRDKGVISLSEVLGRKITADTVMNLIPAYFCRTFGYSQCEKRRFDNETIEAFLA